MKLQYLHQIVSTSTLICCPIHPDCPTLSSPPPQTVTIDWLLPWMGGSCCLGWVAQRLRSAVAGHPDRCPIVPVQSPSYIFAAAIVVNTIVAILVLAITITSSLSSAYHCTIAPRLLPFPSSASSPLAGCCIASPHTTTSHLPSASASHRTVTSRHAPLAPLIQLIVALPFHTPPPPIIPTVISAVVAIIGGGRESSLSSPMFASSSSSFVVIVQLIVTFAGAIVSSIVVATIMAIALGVPVIITITMLCPRK